MSLRGGSQVLRIDRSARSEDNPGTSIVWQLGGTDQGELFPDDRGYDNSLGIEELAFSPEKTCGEERQYSGCWIVTRAVAR